MKVTFPHMGNLWLSVQPALEGMGLEVVVPPPCTRRTLALGSLHAPEFACLPLKLNLGNFLEARALGADTIVMAGGVGPCRFGYYATVQKEILDDLDCRMEVVVLEPPDTALGEVLEKLRYLSRSPWQEGVRGAVLGWRRACAVDSLEREAQKVRAREISPGQADRVYDQAREALARTRNRREVRRVLEEGRSALRAVPQDRRREVVRVAVVGEIYTVLEPSVNHFLERHLGRLGVEVVRSLYLSQWINDHLLGGFLPGENSRRARRLAAPYLNHFVGGHGRESVGKAVEYARAGVDGVVQLAPLTCMPEIVAHSVLPRVRDDYGLPTMTIYLDEQAGEAGLYTRLEAFVDMLARQRAKNSRAGRRRVLLF